MIGFRRKIFFNYLILFVIISLSFYPIGKKLFPLVKQSETISGIIFLLFGIGITILFCLFSLLVIQHYIKPVQRILQAFNPYRLGISDHIPFFPVQKGIVTDEFSQLADTLNSLSRRIESQIRSLIQEKNEKSAILESLAEGVIAVDQYMSVIYMNKMAHVILDVKEDVIGHAFSSISQQSCEALLLEAQKKQQTVTAVVKPERVQKRYLEAIAIPRGENQGAILVLQDKTSFHKILELGKDFIANASHELKTPITIIRGFAETLYDHPDLPQETSREITEKIVSNCQRMDILVKNLLTLAAIDEGLPSSRLQKWDLISIARQAVQTVHALHPEAKITLHAKKKCLLWVDGDLFLQALLNLLDNAVKYSKAPAIVDVYFEKNKDFATVKVSDKGIGIPAEDLDRVFERFYAVDKSRSRALGGSGLGLSIVERIVEKHQGKIEVQSAVGEGTTFTITLPILDLE